MCKRDINADGAGDDEVVRPRNSFDNNNNDINNNHIIFCRFSNDNDIKLDWVAYAEKFNDFFSHFAWWLVTHRKYIYLSLDVSSRKKCKYDELLKLHKPFGWIRIFFSRWLRRTNFDFHPHSREIDINISNGHHHRHKYLYTRNTHIYGIYLWRMTTDARCANQR